MSQQPYLMRSLFLFFFYCDHSHHVFTSEKFNKDSCRNSRGLEAPEGKTQEGNTFHRLETSRAEGSSQQVAEEKRKI